MMRERDTLIHRSYTPSAKYERASPWPATFDEGVEWRMTSPLSNSSHSHLQMFSGEGSRLLQENKIKVDIHGVSGKTSFIEAVFNAINVLLGVGVLSSPFALRSSGVLVGLPLFFFFAVVTNHTAKLLGKCLDYEEGMMTYPDIGEAAFGTKGRIIISVVFFTELFTACAMFDVLIGDTLAALIPEMSQSELMIISYLIIMPTTWTRHLSILSYFSILGILSSIFCLYTVLYIGFVTDKSTAQQYGGSLYYLGKIEWIADRDRIPLAIGLTMVAFGGHSVFPSICSSMSNKKEYPKALDVSYIIVVAVYGAIEIGGYMMYGTKTKKEITLNLIESYPGVLTLLVVWTIALNPMSKIALTLNPVALALEEIFFPEEATSSYSHIGTFSSVYRVLLRTALGVGALCCALYVPHFARVTSFVGAFFAMLASVFLPCICYLKLFYHQLSQKEKCANILLATLSILFAIIGTLSSFISPAD